MLSALAGVEQAFFLRVGGERANVVGDTRGTDQLERWRCSM